MKTESLWRLWACFSRKAFLLLSQASQTWKTVKCCLNSSSFKTTLLLVSWKSEVQYFASHVPVGLFCPWRRSKRLYLPFISHHLGFLGSFLIQRCVCVCVCHLIKLSDNTAPHCATLSSDEPPKKVPVIGAIFVVRDGVKAGSWKPNSPPPPSLPPPLSHNLAQPTWQHVGRAWLAQTWLVYVCYMEKRTIAKADSAE